MARIPKTKQPLTNAQSLASVIKSSRDLMRKDKGLNGDLDRLPMLTWIMFLNFLDDMEMIREQEAILEGKRFRPAIDPPYRWRDWAAKEDGITGDDLIAFINQDEAVRPDGNRGPGLFAYLKSLQGANGKDRRDVIARVFQGVINRMISGYLLRDVINKLNAIHFTSSEEILPYLLAQMNLLLHGLEYPQIDPENSLRFPLREIGDKDRVDIILTNPPFGGEEEQGILGNFPDDKQTAETTLLFLQLIMRKLKRPPQPGRAGVVVPNGTLFGDGVCARIKEELFKNFNLHTIVRLPNGVFAPYTSIGPGLLGSWAFLFSKTKERTLCEPYFLIGNLKTITMSGKPGKMVCQ